MRKKNQKRINPRYFLHETTLREQGADATTALAHIASAVACENPEIASHFGHHFKTLSMHIDDPYYRDQLNVLEKQGPKQDWGFARQAISHLENYLAKQGALDKEAYSQRTDSLTRLCK
tara:strand:+ start:3786 stop:4142 length:357 start_codon:yes stop_codon:yes gene_type:complete